MDLFSATVVVTHEVSDANGDTDLVELTSGKFADGLVTLDGEIDEPTEVEISVQIGDGVKLSTSALLVPGGEVKFWERYYDIVDTLVKALNN